ncbi:MAG TPA: hypothetical protein VIY73_03955 [Polyangiaceae bacterium]
MRPPGPRVLAIAALLVSSTLPLACASRPPPAPVERAPAEPHWQDVFDVMPELLVVVRAKHAREDRVYGPLLRRVLEIAREQSKAVGATRAMDAMSDAEELVFGQRPDTPEGPGELVLVARGVRADTDPGTLVDDDGQPLWSPGPPGRVRELVRARDSHGHPVGASLFELPGRTWVIAQGAARQRAREAFAHPFDRPPLDLAPGALAAVRIDGPSLVARVRKLQDLGELASLGHHLTSVLFTLPPGAEHTVTATLAYSDDAAAASSAVAITEVVGAIARKKPPGLAWLATAKVAQSPKTVVVTAPLPAQLVVGLLHAGSAALDVEVPAPAGP